MPLKLGDAPKGGNSTPAPEGNHLGIAYSVVDLGTQIKKYPDGDKEERQIRIAWELAEELHVFKEENGPEPFTVSRTYAFYTSPKSNLMKDLQAWRNKNFTEEELKTFEIKNLIGKPCLLQVVHKESKGKTYANVTTVSALPKSMAAAVPPMHNKPCYYDLEMGQGSTFQDLPEFLRKIIAKCEEFQEQPKKDEASINQAPAEETNPDREPPEDLEVALGPKGNAGLATPDNSDIPFSPNYL